MYYYDLQLSHVSRHRSNGLDQTPPTVWALQRLPWNPGACGMGELWGYKYTPMATYVLYLAISNLLSKAKSLTVVLAVHTRTTSNGTPLNGLYVIPDAKPTVYDGQASKFQCIENHKLSNKKATSVYWPSPNA